jgi:hypothetical protein
MRRFLLLALVVLVVAGSSSAWGTSRGNDLYKWCSDDHPQAQGLCMGYINGMAHEMEAEAHRGQICLPENSMFSQVMDVVKNYLRDHPDNRHKGTPELVRNALIIAFPCK